MDTANKWIAQCKSSGRPGHDLRHRYSLSRDHCAYVLDTFTVLHGNDQQAFCEFRTKRLCPEAFERFAGQIPACAPTPTAVAG